MEQNLYEIALMRDAVGADMVRIALEDSQIDQAAAVLAWCILAAHGRGDCIATQEEV